MADGCLAALLWKVHRIVFLWHTRYRWLGRENHSLTLHLVVIKEDFISTISSGEMVKRQGSLSESDGSPVWLRNRQVVSILTHGKGGPFACTSLCHHFPWLKGLKALIFSLLKSRNNGMHLETIDDYFMTSLYCTCVRVWLLQQNS